jgi:ABC-type lipoprotein export system ATPase subunit
MIPAPVVARDVRKVYAASSGEAVPALDGVSFSVAGGEMVALIGPSGCGKSTLLNVVGCIDLPSSGEVAIDGSVTSGLDDDALTGLRRERIGTVFQFFNLLPAMTVAQNVALPLVLQGVPRSAIDERVHETLERVGVAAKARAFPAELSGGQAQRVAIARAVIHRPTIVLADEPTGNLDSKNGAVVLDLLRELASRGQTILMATHSSEAASLCDRMLPMQDGRFI